MDDSKQLRFGAIAVKKEFITEDQLFQALIIQAKENIDKGAHRLLGQILLDEGSMTAPQVEEVLEIINHKLLYMLSMGR